MGVKFISLYVAGNATQDAEIYLGDDSVFNTLEAAAQDAARTFVEIQMESLLVILFGKGKEEQEEWVKKADKVGILTSTFGFQKTLSKANQLSPELKEDMIRKYGNEKAIKKHLLAGERIVGLENGDYVTVSRLEY